MDAAREWTGRSFAGSAVVTSLCRQLAWANTGSIARISEDGSKVTFHAMIRDIKASSWKLSVENKHVIEAPEGRKFVHVQFSGLGMDLAIADHVGGVHMYTLLGALGRMGPAPGDYQHAVGPLTELNAVVGLHFLPLFPTELRVSPISPESGAQMLTLTPRAHMWTQLSRMATSGR